MFLTLDNLSSAEVDMVNKFHGYCKVCGIAISPGTKVKWLKPIGIFHVECYEKYLGLESGLEESLTLLLKSPSQAKQKLIQGLTHCPIDKLYIIIEKTLEAVNDYDSTIELLNNIEESEGNWYLQIALASAYLSKGEKKYAADSIDKSIEILSSSKCTLHNINEWHIVEYADRLGTLDKEKMLSLIELLLVINQKSIPLKRCKASLCQMAEALPIDNELLEDSCERSVREYPSVSDSAATDVFLNFYYKFSKLMDSINDRPHPARPGTSLRLHFAEKFASRYDPHLLLPFIRNFPSDGSKPSPASAAEFFEKCDQIKHGPLALFNFYLGILAAEDTGRTLLVQKYCLEFLRLAGPSPFDEIFKIEHDNKEILSGKSALYTIFVTDAHMSALLDDGKKLQALQIFFSRLEDFENGASWAKLPYPDELLDKLLGAWKESDQALANPRLKAKMPNGNPLELFCSSILEKFPNNKFALAKLGMTVPEEPGGIKAGEAIPISEIREKSFDDVGKYPKPEGQNLEFKYSYLLPESDKSKFTGPEAEKSIHGKEKSIQEDVSRSVTAFMNTNEGEVLLGIDDERRYVGVDDEVKKCGSEDKYLQKVKNNLKTHLDDYPRLLSEYVQFNWLTDKGTNKTYFQINVKPVPKKDNLVFCQGIAYVREADGDQSIKESKLQHLIMSRLDASDST